MNKDIIKRLGDIDSEILRCSHLLKILCAYLNEKGIFNEECSIASFLCVDIQSSLEKHQEDLTNTLSDIRHTLYTNHRT